MNKAPKPGVSVACSEKIAETGLFGTETTHWQAATYKISQVRWEQMEKGSEIQDEKSELWQAFYKKEKNCFVLFLVLALVFNIIKYFGNVNGSFFLPSKIGPLISHYPAHITYPRYKTIMFMKIMSLLMLVLILHLQLPVKQAPYKFFNYPTSLVHPVTCAN